MQQNKIIAIPAFDDNYIWCIHNQQDAVVVDPGDAAPVLSFLAQHSLNLVGVLITHHHFDHVGGIQTLKETLPNLVVYGPNNPNIKGLTHTLCEGDTVSFESPELSYNVLETPGHTMDHIAFYDESILFCGDTLFSAGCGRMFEGTAEVFYASLNKLRALPEHTQVYCTHEYTQANVAFAMHVDPSNSSLQQYALWVTHKRQENEITLPSTIKQEHEINPFLRCHIPYVQKNMGTHHNDQNQAATNTFAALRKLKDHF